MRRQLGASLSEILVTMLVGLIIGGALVCIIYMALTAENSSEGQNVLQTSLRQGLDTMSDAIRNAQIGPTQYAVQSGSASDITLYTNGSGDTRRFWRDTSVSPAVLRWSTTSGGITQTGILMSGVQSLTFTYYNCSGNYTNAANWPTTANANQPSAAELPNVGAVDISATLTIRSFTRQWQTTARIRNIPYRTHI